MTPKQERFVEEYLIDLNASAAYQRAGYVAKGNAAEVNASRLLRNAQIKAAVEAGRAKQAKRTNITADRVLRELARIGFSDVGQVLDFSGDEPRLLPANAIPKGARRAIASIKVRRYYEGNGEDARQVEVTEFKLWSKDSALDKLGKHLGLFVEKHEHTGADGGPMRHVVERDLTDAELVAIAAANKPG